jgi:hypothetical protein
MVGTRFGLDTIEFCLKRICNISGNLSYIYIFFFFFCLREFISRQIRYELKKQDYIAYECNVQLIFERINGKACTNRRGFVRIWVSSVLKMLSFFYIRWLPIIRGNLLPPRSI